MITTLSLFAVVITLILLVTYLLEKQRIRRWLRLRPPNSKELQLLKDAVDSGSLDPSAALEAIDIDTLLGGDRFFEGPDWVEIDMWAKDMGQEVKTVDDLIRLLEAINKQYEDKSH